MKLLLDTHILIWALNEDARLPEKAREMILDKDNAKKLLCYFQYVTGTVDDKDEMVQKLLSEGILYA